MSLKGLFSTSDPESQSDDSWASLQEKFSCSLKTRAIGFCVCLGISVTCLIVGAILFAMPAAFAIFFTVGNVGTLVSTFFLIGPMRQLKLFVKPERIIASLIYVGALIMTLFFALYPPVQSVILIIIFIIIQGCALVWYVLSYIPFARRIVKSLLGTCFSSSG